MTIDDLAPDDARGGDGDRGVLRRRRQLLRADHLPVAGARREHAERERQREPDVGDAASDGAVAPSAAPRLVSRASRPGGFGAGGGSTPLSDSASSRPTTIPLTSIDEPP